jgi:HK97 family phage portal protein
MGWLSRKNVQTYSMEAIRWMGWGTSSGGTVTMDTAVDVTAVLCAARVIAEGCSQVPVRVLEETYEGEIKRNTVLRDHPIHKLLSVRPNDWQTPYEFREGMFINAILGAGAIAVKNVVRGEVRELLPVPASAWTVEQDSNYRLKIRINYADKTHGDYGLGDVFYLRGPSLNGFSGIPAVRAARDAIGLSSALERQQATLAKSGGKPSGVLSFGQPLKPESREKLRETWKESFGPGGEGGIAILDGDAKFSTMTMTSVDAQYIETRRMQIEEIARAFRVQPIMLMQADKASTFASAEQMFRNHVIHTLSPWMVRFEQAANRDLLRNAPGLRVDIDERGLLRGDFKDQAEYYTKALGAGGQPGWMTPNEIRIERDMNPGDEAWMNEVPRGSMGQGDTNG